MWVELTVHNTKILLGLFYRPHDSNVLIWDLINQSFENAANAGIDRIMVMSDFFDNQLIAGPSHLKYIIVENGLYQAISEPTYFCKNSSSLLDPLIINNKDILTYHEVGENILEADVR